MSAHSPEMIQPDVSILMTAYNSEKYLGEAINSILLQKTSRTWELLFVDDGSTDATLAIARDFALRHPDKIQLLQHRGGKNRGISASRNLALRHARAPLLAFLDSDDVWLPHHLEIQTALLSSMPEVALVYAGAERWFSFEEPFNECLSRSATWGSNFLPPLLPEGQPSGLLPKGRLLQWFREDESLVPCICTVVVRTHVARQVHGFCNAFRGLYDDQAFHGKIILQHDVYANDICTARYRQHPTSCCHRSFADVAGAEKEQRRLLDFLRDYMSNMATPQDVSEI